MEELTVRDWFILVGLITGILYGVIAQASDFCVRRGIADFAEGKGLASATGWLGAIFIALPLTQWMLSERFLDESQMVYFPESLSWWTTALGAAAFGVGMMLTRGCPARLVVLSATGNLRAWFGLLVLGISAYATFKGLLAESRVHLQQTGTWDLPTESIFALFPEFDRPLVGIGTIVIGFFALRHGLSRSLIGGLLIGTLVAGVWWATAILGSDDFDPINPVSLSFVAPLGETITYVQLASGLEPTFNVALIGGVMLGAFISSMIRQEFQWQTFESAADHVRYFLGAVLMGVGGILALGCSTGQAITGVATGSIWSLLVTIIIFTSGYLTHARLLKSKQVSTN